MKKSLLELEAKIVRHPLAIVMLFIIVTLFFGYLTVKKTNIDNDVTTMLPSDNPVKVYDQDISKIFGQSGGIAIAIETEKDAITKSNLMLIDKITKSLEKIDYKIQKDKIKNMIPLKEENIDGFMQFINEKSFEIQTKEDLKNIIKEDELSLYIQDEIEKVMKIKEDKKTIEKLFNVITSYTDENKLYQKRIRKISSLSNIDAVFSEFTETSKIENFFKKLGIKNTKPFIDLANYMLEKGYTDNEKLSKFLNNDVYNVSKIFNIDDKDLEKIKNLDNKNTEELSTILRSSEKMIKVTNLVDFKKLENEEEKSLFLIRERLKSWELYKDAVYSSKNPKATLVLIETYPQLLKEEREALIKYVEDDLKEIFKERKSEKYYIAGEPVLITAIGSFMIKDLIILFPIVIIVLSGFLYLSFRHFRGVFLPLLSVFISTVWTLGTIALLGKSISIVTTALPVLLVAVGSAYGIHIIHHYYEDRALGMEKEEALKKALKDFGIGVIMAGLTTFAGFASLYTSSVIPLKEFGVFAAIGVIYALLASLILIPAILRLGRLPKKIEKMKLTSEEDLEKESDKVSHILRNTGTFIAKNSKTIIVFYALAVIIFAIGAYFIKVEINPIEYFKKTTDIYISDEYIRNNFSGTSTLNIVINTNKQNGVLDVELMKKIESLQEKIKGFDNIGKVTSIVDFIKKMHQTMNYGDPNFYKIPDEVFDEKGNKIEMSEENKKEALRSIMLSYIDQYDKDDTRLMIDSTKSKLKIGIILKTGSTIATKEVTEKIKKLASETINQDLGFSGVNTLYLEVNKLIVNGQIWNIISSAIMVAILVGIMFKSLLIGSISILPLLIAIVFNFAIMALFNVHLDVATAIIANIAIGTGVDYTIHFLNGYTILRKKGETKEQAIINTGVRNGKAILINALSVAAGFLVLCLSNFKPLINVGWIIALTMITTSFLALTLIPTILSLSNLDKKIIGGNKWKKLLL